MPQNVVATGGNIVKTFYEGNVLYRAHVFTSSGTLTISNFGINPNYAFMDVLMIGGGGSGGHSAAGFGGGGGGAGGVFVMYNALL